MSLSTSDDDRPDTLTNTNNVGKTISCIESEAKMVRTGEFSESLTEDLSDTAKAASNKLEGICHATEINGKLNNPPKPLDSADSEQDKESVQETRFFELQNEREDQIKPVEFLHTENNNGRDDIAEKFEDGGKVLPKQAVVEETTEVPNLPSGDANTMATERNSCENQDPVIQPGNELDPQIISRNDEQKRDHEDPIPDIETYQCSDANKKERDKKTELSVTIEKQDSSSLNLAVSEESQLRPNNANNAEVPQPIVPSSQQVTKSGSDIVKLLPASESENLVKDCQNYCKSKTTKEQSETLNNSKLKTFTATSLPSITANHDTPYLNKENKNVKLYENATCVNLRTTPEIPYLNTSRSPSITAVQTKPIVSLLPKISAENSTLYQNGGFSQPVYNSNRPIQPNTPRPTEGPVSLQRVTGSYLDNSTLLANKHVNEINQSNPTNFYNANPNNAMPLNLSDLRLKQTPTNYKAANPNRFEVQNTLQQHYQPTVPSPNLSINNKDVFEYDPRCSFQTTPRINNGLSHNQRSYFKTYDGQSMQYATNPDNLNLRRNSLCESTYAVGNGINNNSQAAGNFSVQQFQQYTNQFGSQYLFMWPNHSDQLTGTGKLRMPQPSTNQATVSSYQQPYKNTFPNLVNDHVYLNQNDGKLCKSPFADRRMGFNLDPNQVNMANTPLSFEHQQQIQRAYNRNEKGIPTSHSETFRNNNNNNNNKSAFPVGQNSLQWGQSSGHMHHHQNSGQTGNDLKTKLPQQLQSNSRALPRSQTPNSQLQRSSIDHQHPDPRHFPVTNANSFLVSDQRAPSPKIQNATRSQFKTGHPQYSVCSQSNTPNLAISNCQGSKMTTTATTILTTATTLEDQKKSNTSSRDGSRLGSGQHSELQRYRNSTSEFSTGRSGQSMSTYYTQPTTENCGRLGAQFQPAESNTIRLNYANPASDKGPMLNNSDSSLTWSQYYPQSLDPMHNRGYMNFDSQQREQTLTPFNAQQNNINSPLYVSQSFNYKQQNLSTTDGSQETQKHFNTSYSATKATNVVSTYNYMQQYPMTAAGFPGSLKPPNSSGFDRGNGNVETAHNYSHQNPATSVSLSTECNTLATHNNSNMSGQTFENVRTDNQRKISCEKLSGLQDISQNMAADKETFKAGISQKRDEFPAKTESNKPNSTGSEKLQEVNCASALYPMSVEMSAESVKSGHALASLSVPGSLRKPDEFSSKDLTNQNPGLTSDESFLFSDFDPLFTSSLLTNELEYFPETNAAFDQCFEDAASVTMAMVALNESRTRETLDPVHANEGHALQQQQLNSLLNITSNNNYDGNSNDNGGGGSLAVAPSSRLQYNQVPPSQITLGTNQITNQYNPGVDTNTHPTQLPNKINEAMIGYVPSGDLLTLSSKTSRGDIDKPTSAYQNGSVQNGFSDFYSINPVSHVTIPIVYNTTGTKLVNTKDTNAKLCDSGPGPGIKRRNRQKSNEIKGPPKRRGRPPKNPVVEIKNHPSAKSTNPERGSFKNPAVSLNGETDIFEKILPKPRTTFSGHESTDRSVISVTPKLSMENASPVFPDSADPSAESGTPGNCVGTDRVGNCITEKIDPPKADSSLPENTEENSLKSTKCNRELSDREVIDVVTKCLESISRNENHDHDQIPDGQPDTNSPLDGTDMVETDFPIGSDTIAFKDQVLSKEETLMNAYIELKKKLEERMSRTLWRQSYLKRHEPKNPNYSRKLSKKECMTAYSGTTSIGPGDDVFSRYPNRSEGNGAENLVTPVDSTNTYSKSAHQKQISIQDNPPRNESEPVITDQAPAQDQIPVSNEKLVASLELSDPKRNHTLRLPSMAEVVRTRLSNDTPAFSTSNPGPLPSEIVEKSPVRNPNIPTKLADSVEEPDQLKKVKHIEGERVNNPQPGLSTRHLTLQPYSPSPLLPPPPPPPMPPRVVHSMSKRDKKVGPTIVENARHCFEAIAGYLTKANSDFDSFLISYANIVQGLLNCRADRYSRIKAILLSRDNLESDTAADEKYPNAQLVSDRDIDASEIQGESDRREDEIDVEEFNSSYADVVKVILSSRADEYRNIKQALSKHICGFTDLCQWPTGSSAKKGKEPGVERDISVSAPTDCDDKSGASASKVEMRADSDPLGSSLIVSGGVNQVVLSKPEQKSNKGETTDKLSSKKRRQRKVQERLENSGPQSNLTVNDGILRTKAKKKVPRQRVKNPSKTGSVLKDRKQSSLAENENSSGLRIILSSNSFIEQKMSYLDSKIKLKPEVDVEKDENLEFRRPVSSDDGFVEESTGDYIMNMDSESGGETKVPGISENECSTKKAPKKIGAVENPKLLENIQPEIPKKKTATGSSKGIPLTNKGGGSDETPQVSVDKVGDVNKVVTVNTVDKKTVRRPRSSRRSAGVGPIKCPCGCCDNNSSLKSDSAEDERRVGTSFRKRNRAKIIKPKKANPLKRRGRSQKMQTRPQKIISPLLNPDDYAPPIRSDDEDPFDIKMPKDLFKGPALSNMSPQTAVSPDDRNKLKVKREFYSKLASDLDSNDSSDDDVFANCASPASDEKQIPKNSAKNGTKKATPKNRLNVRYNFAHKRKSPFIGNDPAQISAKETKKKIEEGNETSTNGSFLNPNSEFQSLESSEDVNTAPFTGSRREKRVSKKRISFKEFVPKITPTPLVKKENLACDSIENAEASMEHAEASMENAEASSRIFSCDISNIKIEPEESSPSLDLDGDDHNGLTVQSDRLHLTDNDAVRDLNDNDAVRDLTDNDAVRDLKDDVSVGSLSISNDVNFQPQDGGGRNKASDKPNESSSCEDRLRSLIETITEINTKQIDEDQTNSVKRVVVKDHNEGVMGNDSETSEGDQTNSVKSVVVKDHNEGVMGNDSETSEGDRLGLKITNEMRVKTEIVNRIDETLDCQIGINDMEDDDNSSITCDSSSDGLSSSSSSEEDIRMNFRGEKHSRSDSMEVKIPSPLNSRKRTQSLKVASVGYENKIIIRKTWQDKTKKFHGLKRKSKNIFDILSSNETEENKEGRNEETPKKRVNSNKKALSMSLGVKRSEKGQRSKSKKRRTKNADQTDPDPNPDSDTEKLRLSLTRSDTDGSVILSEKTKYPRGNNLKTVTDGKKKKKKMSKSFLSDTKTLPDSEGLAISGFNKKDITESTKTGKKMVIRESFKKQFLDAHTKPKKPSKMSKISSDELGFYQQQNPVSSDSTKRKKRKTSFETQINSPMSTDTEMEPTDMLAVNGIVRGRIGERTDEFYPDAKFRTPLKRGSSHDLQGGKDQLKLKVPVVDFPNLQCTYCPRYFKRPSELLYHTRTHTGERPFICDLCPKGFASNAALNRHRRTHSSERKHICETCGRGFVQHYGMLVHQLIHSGLKPHKCPDCPSAFRTKGSLSSHRRRRHPEEVEKETA